MTNFDSLGLSDKALAAVKRMGYEQPTPVQEQAIPLVLKGRDIIAAAQTGTGKTAAFCLPAMDKLGHASKGTGPLMLVITPTRELAQQIGEVADHMAISTHHRITTVVGGLSYKPQIERLTRGTDVLIATPGRLIDLMQQKAVDLSSVQVLVLDEADRMLDMGFLPSVKQIVAATPKSRQTLLFSATIDRSILDITGKMLRDPATVEIARKGDVAKTIEHYIIRVPQSVKPAALKAVLQEKGFYRVIVFARTRSRADSSCRKLRRAGYAVEAIHSDRSQNQRKRALEKFSKGDVNIITATDVLARGIDVSDIDYVINFDVPEQPEDYIHRIGRTGRAGSQGFAVTFVTPETESQLRDIEKLIKHKIPEMKLRDFDLAAAEAESAANAINAQAKRDPEVNRAKRDMLNKARKKAELADERKASREQEKRNKQKRQGQFDDVQPRGKGAGKSYGKGAGKAGGRGGNAGGQPHGGENGRSRRNEAGQYKGKGEGRRGKPAQPSRTKQQGRRSGAQKSGDFRPGRAHRAEVRQRTRSRKSR